LKVTYTDVFGLTADLYSAVEQGQSLANITPLTQMVTASALGADPASVFATVLSASTAAKLSKSALSSAVISVQQIAAGMGIDISGIDPLKTPLVTATNYVSGNSQDQKIDGLMLALKNSNISVATLTTAVVANAGAPSATLVALQAAADPNAPLTSSSLSGCQVARTGAYLYAAPGSTTLNRVFYNFSTTTTTVTSPVWGSKTLAPMTGWDYTNSAAISITAVTGVNCAYQFRFSGIASPVNVRMSASGLAVFSMNGPSGVLPNPVNTLFDGGATSIAGLMVPIQKNWTRANLAGTGYAMHLAKLNNSNLGLSGSYRNFYSKFVIATGGATAEAWSCNAPGTCGSTPTASFTVAGPDPIDGTFTLTSVNDSTPSQVAFYMAPNGDVIVFGVNTSPSFTLTNNFFVMSKRASVIPKRVLGETWSNISWTLDSPSLTAVSQSSTANTFSVTAVNGNSFNRSFGTYTDTITLDSPIPGMISRTNGTNSAINGLAPIGYYGFTGAGWTVYASSAPNLDFLGFSIDTP
jgi:hypothetical protein